MQRVALHPLDQFLAFVAVREGQDKEAIAAAFFVTPQIVKQRLRLASVAPALLDRLVTEKFQVEAAALTARAGSGPMWRPTCPMGKVTVCGVWPVILRRCTTRKARRMLCCSPSIADWKRILWPG